MIGVMGLPCSFFDPSVWARTGVPTNSVVGLLCLVEQEEMMDVVVEVVIEVLRHNIPGTLQCM